MPKTTRILVGWCPNKLNLCTLGVVKQWVTQIYGRNRMGKYRTLPKEKKKKKLPNTAGTVRECRRMLAAVDGRDDVGGGEGWR